MGRPPYLVVADAVAALVEDGTLRPGDLVPSARALRDEHGVALATATRAHAELARRGLTVAVPGIGTRVVDRGGRHAARDVVTAGERPGPAGSVGSVGSAGSAGTADVVRAAVRIADAEGMAAVSIRRIAGELGLPTMAVYRYVPNKEQLVRLMTDEVFGEVRLPRRRPRRWRAALELAARAQWHQHLRHPWIASTMSFSRPVLAPRGMDWTEWLMAVLDDAGFDPGDQLLLAMTVAGFVHGMGAKLEREVEDLQYTGVSAADWMAAREDDLAAVAGPSMERFPRLVAAARGTADEDFDLDAMFETGLALLLDGIAQRVPARRGRGVAR